MKDLLRHQYISLLHERDPMYFHEYRITKLRNKLLKAKANKTRLGIKKAIAKRERAIEILETRKLLNID